jgi:hypothetical protein
VPYTLSLYEIQHSHVTKELIPTTSRPNLLSESNVLKCTFRITLCACKLYYPFIYVVSALLPETLHSFQHWSQVVLFTGLNNVCTEDFHLLGYNGV